MDQELKAEIKALEDRAGKITAEIIFEAAKKPGTALHGYGIQHEVWNKDRAAHHYGVQIFRQLLTQWRVEVETNEVEVTWRPEYVRDPKAAPKTQGMISVARIKSNKQLNREVLIPYLQRAIGNMETALALADGLGYSRDLQPLIISTKGLIEKIKRAGTKESKKNTGDRPNVRV